MKKIYVSRIFVLFLSFIVFGIVFLQEEVYPFAIGVDRPSITVVTKPGETESIVIRVKNSEEASNPVKAYKQDWLYNQEGKAEFKPEGSLPSSCSNWITIYPTEFEVPGEGYYDVELAINTPEDAMGGHYCVIFFETFAGRGVAPDGSHVKILGRIGTVIYQETEGLTNKIGQINFVNISEPDEDKPLKISYEFENKGNAFLKAKGIANILDKEGNLYGKAEQKGSTRVLPGDKRTKEIEWLGTLPEGEYDILLTLDMGEGMAPLLEEVSVTIIKEADIGSIEVEQTAEAIIPSIIFKNKGNLNIAPKGSINIYKNNVPIATKPIEEMIIPPKKSIKLSAGEFKNLEKGTCIIKAIVIYDQETITKETKYQIR